MINLKVILPIVGIVLLTASPVKADWQFTKWGMTPEQLKEASPIPLLSRDSCPINNSGVLDIKYASNWEVGSMKFIACYIFDKDKLNGINLYSRSVDEKAVIKGLSQKYGSPIISNNLAEIGIYSYRWDLPDEKIIFYINSREKQNYKTYIITYRSKKGTDENAVRDGL